MGAFFGGIGNLFNIIFTYPMLNVLMLLYHLFGDFGLSIVVLTLILRLIIFPLTLKQLKSMKATQALQPQMQEIKRKYAKDQQAQMQAMQALYKEYGISPMGGCLPLLVQMPILYGLYFAFDNVLLYSKTNGHFDVNKLNSHLYPFVQNITHFVTFPNLDFAWFSWLSFLNPILHVDWSWTFSLASPDPSHVLPVIAALATFLQIRMSQARTTAMTASAPAAKDAPPDPTQQTMKMMQYIMPVVTFIIGLSFPAGLALYWTVSSLFQAVQQYFVTGASGLFTMPDPKPKTGTPAKTVNSNPPIKPTSSQLKREKPSATQESIDNSEENVEEDDEDDDEKPGPVASSMRTKPNTPRPSGNGSGAYQYTRRQRGGSASARRRSGAQRSRR